MRSPGTKNWPLVSKFSSFPPQSNNETADVLTSVPTYILEAFIPGFGILSRLIEVSIGVDITTLVSTCFVVVAVLGVFNYVGRAAWNWVVQSCTCSISIFSNDKLYEQIMLWISLQDLTVSSRSLRATTNKRREETQTGGQHSHHRSTPNYYFAEIESSIPPDYTPAFGKHHFWHKGNLVLFHREQEKQSLDLLSRNPQQDREVLHLKCFGWSPSPIKQLLMECKRLDAQQNRSMTTIRRSSQGPNGQWSYASRRPSRSLETVFMDETVKAELLQDVREFLDPATPVFYARRGIPYRRGYLFHGHPGTGKTSLSFSLAGTFGFELFTVSLREPFMSEPKLTQLFASLPSRCIVLLEDVDTAGLEKRPKGTEEENVAQSEAERRPRIRNEARPFGNQTITTQGAEGITLSGLLNAIDGVASQEGRILIMTTNDPESLDSALIRPGRVDMQVYFSNASRQHVRQIFLSMYSRDAPEDIEQSILNTHMPRKQAHSEDETASGEDRIEDFAARFADIVPDRVFTPAEVQGFLLMRRKNPEKAIGDAPSWRDALLAAREAGRNVVDASAVTPDEDTATGRSDSQMSVRS